MFPIPDVKFLNDESHCSTNDVRITAAEACLGLGRWFEHNEIGPRTTISHFAPRRVKTSYLLSLLSTL